MPRSGLASSNSHTSKNRTDDDKHADANNGRHESSLFQQLLISNIIGTRLPQFLAVFVNLYAKQQRHVQNAVLLLTLALA